MTKEVKGKRPIIDFRCRPNTAEYLKVLEAPMFQSVIRKVGTPSIGPTDLDGWIQDMKHQGVQKVVFTGRDSKQTSQYDVTNEYVAEVAKHYPDVVIGFAGINPILGRESTKAVEHAILDLGLKGVSIDPFGCGARPNDARLFPVYQKCAEMDIPVVITCGPLPFRGTRMDYGHVAWIDDVAETFPDMSIVISHGGWPYITETIALAFRHENVYVDTSFYSHLPGGELLAQAANTIISDKLLFASGFPIVSIETAVERIENMPFSPESLEKVMHSNAEALLRRHKCL